MPLGSSEADFLFKKMYPYGIDEDALERDNPLMRWSQHETDFTTHKGIEIAVPYLNPQGIGATNADANTAEAPSAGVSFTVPQRHVTALGRINGEVVRNAINGGDASQFADALEREVDGTTESLGSEINQRMYGQSDGVRSFLSSTTTVNTTVVTLASPEEAQLYEPKMRLQAVNPADGSLRSAGAFAVVDKVDPIAGTLTFTAAANVAIAAIAAGDGLVRWSMNTKDLDGLKGWIPATVSGADSFLGVNRSVYRTRLAGVYQDVSSMSIRTGLIKVRGVAKAQVGNKFKSKSPFFINPRDLTALMQTIEASRIIEGAVESRVGVGIETIEIFGRKFIEDPHCPVGETFQIGERGFTRGSCGKQPQIDDQDGNKFWYNRATGFLEFVLAHDGNSYSREPHTNLRAKLGAAA
ncbi:MAG TPA: hypothetical protein VFZ61_03685 [Polyangiales bacterium]